MTVTHEQLMRIIFYSLLLVFAFDVLAIKRAPESFQKEDIDNGINYLFQVRPARLYLDFMPVFLYRIQNHQSVKCRASVD